MANRIKIFTPVWGTKHLGLLKYALGKSLSWPKNFEFVKDAEWFIVSETDDELSVAASIIKDISSHISISAFKFPMISKLNSGMALMDPLMAVIKSCLKDQTPLLMATPDFIYSDGAIESFQAIACDEGACCSISHMRVVPEILNYTQTYPQSNAKLMSLAFRFPHRTFVESPKNLSKGGIYKWDFGNIKAIQHYMPSPFFVNFMEQDLRHFQENEDGKPPGFGMWDHLWPSRLIEEGRLRFIGSSDLACMVEVTDNDKNVAPLDAPGEVGFFRNHFHNKIQKQFISIYRGE